MFRLYKDILNVVQKGTHQVEKFILSEDHCKIIEEAGCEIKEVRGTDYNPISNKFLYSKPDRITYILTTIKE